MDLNMSNRKIFIGGTPRTGTSLLQSILCYDDETYNFLPEPSHLMALLDVYREGKMNWEKQREYEFISNKVYMMIHKTAIQHFFEQISKLGGEEKRFVLKHPQITTFFPDLVELFPKEFDFFIMVRDPLDTISSFKSDHYINGEKLYDIEEYLNHYINPYMSLYYLDKSLCNFYFVQYENLIMNPDNEMERLRNLTGLKLDFDLREVVDLPSHEMYENDQRRKNQTKLLDNKIGNHKKFLEDEDIEFIMERKEDIINVLGFDPFYED